MLGNLNLWKSKDVERGGGRTSASELRFDSTLGRESKLGPESVLGRESGIGGGGCSLLAIAPATVLNLDSLLAMEYRVYL